jgi:uncharacterized membrane protein YcaP (DUF421 family)
MLEQLSSWFSWLLGLSVEGKDLSVSQMSARAVVVFIAAIVIIRVGDKRFMGRHTALDVMLGIIFGSIVSRAISGNAPFFPTLAACLVLVIVHWIINAIAFRSHGFGLLVKGRVHQLVIDGEIDWRAMRHTQITERDLAEALRSRGYADDLDQILSAFLERSGKISILLKEENK